LSHAKTSQDFIKWMNTQQGPPPVRPWVGTTDLLAGGAMLLDVYFEPGAYSTVCRGVSPVTDAPTTSMATRSSGCAEEASEDKGRPYGGVRRLDFGLTIRCHS
jgi:hypothetical protein